MVVTFTLNGAETSVSDTHPHLLAALREELGVCSPKDGCAPSGQCGCCTVLVDGSARVACVTPAERIAGRVVTTVDGLDPVERDAMAASFVATGGSQCGFCTPGIVVRAAALRGKGPVSPVGVDRALAAHLCRCTGWQTIGEAWDALGAAVPSRDLAAAGQRASIEGRVPQRVGPTVPLGRVGFADDTAPENALVAVPDGRGGWATAETLTQARRLAGTVQGRRSTVGAVPPLEVAPGSWDLTLRTSWVEPAYLETDAAWCLPGGEPVSPVANGGAFGGKADSPVRAAARELADRHGRPVRVILSREDTVRDGPKRPPVAIGARADGSGAVRVVRTAGIRGAIHSTAPGFEVEELDVQGPPTSSRIRAAGWAEAAIVLAGLQGSPEATVTSPDGAVATASVGAEGVRIRVRCGPPLDAVVLRSYCIGAAHMALGWVRQEGLALGHDGVPVDLTIRSFGIVRPAAMPPVEVEIEVDGAASAPVNGSDAVFAAVAAADWIRQGCPPDWPTGSAG
ncbi:MAG TPA: 2Fe-2S iron-sulfur cluster-binding protein [Acidimicrobiales bacterium]